MQATELIQKFLNFFVKKGHQVLPNVSLIPENDPTVLFTTAGMHPLVPYLLGEIHPLGKKLVSLQRCLRTDDIEEVGDAWHNTFFEMLGNWSLGGYWKEEAISWSGEFLTKELAIPLGKISVTVFGGDVKTPADKESAQIWQKIGIPVERIYPLGKDDNFWGPVGLTGPCGPDTEMFYDTGKGKCGSDCRPGCHCGKYAEIWNDVFMEYEKKRKSRETIEYEFTLLKQKNVDTGMGIERTTAILQGKDNVYETELFAPIMQKIDELTSVKETKSLRIIADHLRAATFILGDGVIPANVECGYILRRLIRRAIRHGKRLGIGKDFTFQVARVVIENYQERYLNLAQNEEKILQVLTDEERRFSQTLSRGLKELEKSLSLTKGGIISGEIAFRLYESYGFPLEMTEEEAQEKGLQVDKEGFLKAMERHQEKSRVSAEKKFAGGLTDHSEAVTKLHTATHLLHRSLRVVLGEHVRQTGSNITAQRLRFDFSHRQKLTGEEREKVENLVNQKIAESLPVKMEVMTLEVAQKKGALAFFGERYGEKVKVYSINEFSKEVCGGPHVNFTGSLGKFKIVKEESAGAGVRRIYATLG